MMSLRSQSPAALALLLVGIPAFTQSKSQVSHGLDLKLMDRTIAPGDDFYAHANGAWIKGTEIAPQWPVAGVGLEVFERTSKRTRAIIEEAVRTKAPKGTELRKIGDYFTSYADLAAIDAKGMAPVRPALDRIAALQDAKALAAALGATVRADVDVLNSTALHTGNPLGLWVAQDVARPGTYLPYLLQGGLGLPDRDYYLQDNPAMAKVREAYQAYASRLLSLAGFQDAEAKAARIVALEKAIAQSHASVADTFNVDRGLTRWTRADFDAKAPGLDWGAFLSAAGVGGEKVFGAWQPEALTGFAALVAKEPLETWKDYLAYHELRRHADVLPEAVRAAHFDFFGRTLSGTAKPRERADLAVGATEAALGEAVGKRYVAKWFPASEKARAKAMVKHLIEAFRKRIDALDWMAPETKAKAKAKLDVLKVGVGYPDRWHSYDGLEVVAGDAYGNKDRASRFATTEQLAKLGRPVDRDEWVMFPQTVNAVNLPSLNAMNFPAAILQPPYFDAKAPLAMDYGAIGAVIGHEISHSFDDQGARFDATGRLTNWWTKEDLARFEASGASLAKQYDGYKPFPDLGINGKQTLNENIADLAGLAAALDAFHLATKGHAKALQGFTPDQQFFLAYAQSWRGKERDAALRNQLMTDGHAPGKYRVFTVRNLDAWYAAFGVTSGQALYLDAKDRVRIW